MSLTTAPTRLAQLRKPDFSVTFHAQDGRRIKIGRIFQARAGVPKGNPWVWILEHDGRKVRTKPHDGNASSFEDAKSALKRCWESGVPIDWPPSLHDP